MAVPSLSSCFTASNSVERNQLSCPGKEAQVGEFSAPLSSTESSESEASPAKKGIPEVRSQQSSLFEFHGNARMHAGVTSRRVHTRPPHLRKHVKRNLNRKDTESMFQGGFSHNPDRDNTSCEMDFSPHAGSTSAKTTYEVQVDVAQHANAPHIDSKSVETTYQKATVQHSNGSDGCATEDFRTAAVDSGIGKEEKVNQDSGCYDDLLGQSISHISSQKRGKWKRVPKKEQKQEFERMESRYQVRSNFSFGAHPSGIHVPGALNSKDGVGCDNTGANSIGSPMDTTYPNNISGGRSVSVQGITFLINEKKGNDKQTQSSEASFIKPTSDTSSSKSSSLPRMSTGSSVMKTATAEQVCEGWRLRLVIPSPSSSLPILIIAKTSDLVVLSSL